MGESNGDSGVTFGCLCLLAFWGTHLLLRPLELWRETSGNAGTGCLVKGREQWGSRITFSCQKSDRPPQEQWLRFTQVQSKLCGAELAAVSKTSQGHGLSRSPCHHPRVWSSPSEPNRQREFHHRDGGGTEGERVLGRCLELPQEAGLGPLGQD